MSDKIQNTDLLIGQGHTAKGKIYELRNSANNGVFATYKINHTRELSHEAIEHKDGSMTSERVFLYVSECGRAWFRVYGYDGNVYFG